MSVTIWAELGGSLLVPLADCDWVLWRACGCPQGVTVGAFPELTHVTATEEAAWACLYDTAEEIAAARERGERVELVTSERVRAEVLPLFGKPCGHGKDSSGERTAGR